MPQMVAFLRGINLGKRRIKMDDLRAADVDFLTVGQYLQPTSKHHAVRRFVTPGEFKAYETAAYGKGFLMVSATPLTRFPTASIPTMPCSPWGSCTPNSRPAPCSADRSPKRPAVPT